MGCPYRLFGDLVVVPSKGDWRPWTPRQWMCVLLGLGSNYRNQSTSSQKSVRRCKGCPLWRQRRLVLGFPDFSGPPEQYPACCGPRSLLLARARPEMRSMLFSGIVWPGSGVRGPKCPPRRSVVEVMSFYIVQIRPFWSLGH